MIINFIHFVNVMDNHVSCIKNHLTAQTMKWMYKIVIPKISHCWGKVASFLNYPISKKKEIYEKYKGDPEKCCTELLENWIESDHGAKPKTWTILVSVLKDINELKAASSEIEEELSKQGLL